MSIDVLVVDDEQKIRALLVDYLQQSDFSCYAMEDGLGVRDYVLTQRPRLVLLDLMLPGKDGLSVCREIRSVSDIPIIMVTARVDEIDRLLGLELGADDYICKPFSPREVVARVKAVLRRLDAKTQFTLAKAYSYRGIEVKEDAHLVLVNGTQLDLTPVEFRLLNALVTRPNLVFSRQQLMDVAYQDARVVSDRTIDTHMKNLRKKLSGFFRDEEVIRSVYGVGYRID
ncbi:MAG: response regulator [Pseudomonadota bacterium]